MFKSFTWIDEPECTFEIKIQKKNIDVELSFVQFLRSTFFAKKFFLQYFQYQFDLIFFFFFSLNAMWCFQFRFGSEFLAQCTHVNQPKPKRTHQANVFVTFHSFIHSLHSFIHHSFDLNFYFSFRQLHCVHCTSFVAS